MNNNIISYSCLIFFSVFCVCNAVSQSIKTSSALEKENPNLKNYNKAIFASGCFWCVESIFESVNGVYEVFSGYAGGDNRELPTYKKVSAGISNHAEANIIYYDDKIVDFEELVKVYFNSKDNISKTCQGPDCGASYRSILFYSNEKEKEIINKIEKQFIVNGKIPKNHNNKVKKIGNFYIAEEYHQNFKRKNPKHSYIQSVSIPRFNKFKKIMPTILKKTH